MWCPDGIYRPRPTACVVCGVLMGFIGLGQQPVWCPDGVYRPRPTACVVCGVLMGFIGLGQQLACHRLLDPSSAVQQNEDLVPYQ